LPLFRKEQPAQGERARAIMTVNGWPQHQPETAGKLPRRYRLFVECERRLSDDPLAGARGQPLGDGLGLEGLVAKIAPLFERERSLIRWVALRGAIAELSIRVLDQASAAAEPADLEEAMGLSWPAGQPHPDVAPLWRPRLSEAERDAVLGVAASALTRAEDYARYEAMSVRQVNTDPSCQRLGDAVALDCIAWSAVAMLRLGIAQQIFPQVPEPDALPEPGWYTEPLFAESERYWDGNDWTAACRASNGRGYQQAALPLR
jgi:hypothetical protein